MGEGVDIIEYATNRRTMLRLFLVIDEFAMLAKGLPRCAHHSEYRCRGSYPWRAHDSGNPAARWRGEQRHPGEHQPACCAARAVKEDSSNVIEVPDADSSSASDGPRLLNWGANRHHPIQTALVTGSGVVERDPIEMRSTSVLVTWAPRALPKPKKTDANDSTT